MRYYALDIEKPPTVRLAHGYSTEHYNIRHDVASHGVEILYVERGDMVITWENGMIDHYNTCSLLTVPDLMPCVFTSTDGRQTHFTVGLSGSGNFIREFTTEEVINHKNDDKLYAILPEYITESEGSAEYQKLIKQIIECHAETGVISLTRRTSLLYELFARLTEYSLNVASNESSKTVATGNHYYRSALKYIASHLDSHIYVADVAEYVGISVGYLSNIFRESANCTMVDYINKQKLNLVCEFIVTKNITLEEAGRLVAINDVKYLSRLFKRYNGVTAEAYRALHNNALKMRDK